MEEYQQFMKDITHEQEQNWFQNSLILREPRLTFYDFQVVMNLEYDIQQSLNPTPNRMHVRGVFPQ